MTWPTLGQPLRLLHFLRLNGLRTWIAESKTRRAFFRRDLGGSFQHRAKWMAQGTGIFRVRVVDAPELVGQMLSCARAHTGSSAQDEGRRV